MGNHAGTAALVIAGVLVVLAVISLLQGRMVLAGTLFLFTAFAIYIREVTT